MKPAILMAMLVLGILADSRYAAAQPPAKIPRVGVLCAEFCPVPPWPVWQAFLQGLQELGSW